MRNGLGAGSELRGESTVPGELLWSPPADVRERSRVGHYLSWLEEHRGLRFPGYPELWEWSVTDLEGFWSSICEHFDVRFDTPYDRVLASKEMPGASWFTGSTLNYAEHVLRGVGGANSNATLISAHSDTRPPRELTAADLSDQVARIRAGLVRLGVRCGDRIAAYMPNIPETMAAFLATASIGAIWSSCPPEFGARSALDRFRQIEPKLLLAVDGYRFGSQAVDRAATLADVRASLPSLEAVVTLPYLGAGACIPDALTWSELTAKAGPLAFDPVPFDHPLSILYSSGTTGLPKPIVHSHGGILLEHLKTHALQHDLGPGDRFFWFTTTGWMVWNWMVSVPLTGSSIVMFDGDPQHPDLGTLWRVAAETGTTTLGVSAAFALACRKADLVPRAIAELSSVQTVISSGSPLPPEGFRWVYGAVGEHIYLVSTSGGTDVCSAFVGGSPLLPVRAGEIACPCLGCKVEAYDEHGRPTIGRPGELVVSQPMPSMPIGFWNDPDNSRYRAAYFEAFPGVWCHGDWITMTESGSSIITGRSDATLNRGGVRMGTSEFYSIVESFGEVTDSLVVHLEDAEYGLGELLLFVVLADGAKLDENLESRIADALRVSLSPRHVPDAVHAVPAVPRTLTGKKLELPVKRILTGTAIDQAASRGSLADPNSLIAFEGLARQRCKSVKA